MRTIIKNIKEFDKSELNSICSKLNNINKDLLIKYLNNLNDFSNFSYIEAYNQENESIAGICYQICDGPLPPIPTFFKCGSLWVFGVKKLH